MKKSSTQLVVAAIVSILTLSALSARALTDTNSNDPYNGGSNPEFSAISSSDLLENSSSSLSSVSFTKTANTAVITTLNSGINDGLSVVNGFGDSTYYAYNSNPGAKANLIPGNELAGGAEITFNLNTSVNTLGYNINSINSIAGWTDHASVADQNFTLAYSTVAAPLVFIPVTSVAYNPYNPTSDSSDGGGVASLVSLTSLNLVGVKALQFDYTADPTSAGTGDSGTGIWLQEIDATGSATIPEPSTWAMMIVGAAGVVVLSLRRLVRA
jgi:hypothetical protein